MTHPPVPEAGVPTCYRHPARESHIRCQRCDRAICPDCMRDAAVGFQCPDCVAQGARTTRSGRTAYGGKRPANPGLTSKVLIGLNAAVFVLVLATGYRDSRLLDWLMLRPNGLCTQDGFAYEISRSACTGTWYPGVADGAVWQVLTGAFTHVQLWHIGFNMLALYLIGPQLELVLGRLRFLALYFLSALTGAAAVMWLSAEYGATLGASGAIYGLLGAMLVVARKVGGDVQQLLLLIGVNVLLTFVVPNISWQGHLGGFVGGAAIAAILVHAPRGPRRTTVQVAGLTAIAVLTVAAIAVRAALLAA